MLTFQKGRPDLILFTFHLERCLRPSGGQSFLAKDFVVTEKAEGIEGEWEVCRVQIGEGLFKSEFQGWVHLP